MPFSIIYQKLFTVSFRHGYHQAGGGESAGFDWQGELRLKPSVETQRKMQQLGMVFKTNPTDFFVGMRAAEQSGGSYAPFKSPPQNLRLVFYLYLQRASFLHYTNLPLRGMEGKIFWLGNFVGTMGGNFPSLSQPIPARQSGNDYFAGDLVANSAQDKIYEATADTNQALTSNDWLERPFGHYVSAQDALPMVKGKGVYPIDTGGADVATVTVTDPASGGVVATYEVTGESLTEIPLQLQDLPEGRYQISLSGDNGFSADFPVFNSDLFQEMPLAAIEVMHADMLPEAYRLLNADGTFREPGFVVDFLNRATFWRYNFPQEQEIPDTDLGDLARGGAGEKKVFVTKQPKPLQQDYLEIQKFNTTELLPNPGKVPLRPEPDSSGQGRIFSDVFL